MDNSTGSYPFDKFEHPNAETQRLNHQAILPLAIEQKIWSQVGLTPGLRVLDLGCGSGMISQAIAEWVYPGQVVGVDISEDLLTTAKQLQSEKGINNLNFEQGNVYNLKFNDNFFDFIYSRLLFQHLQHPEKVLQELYRVLKPDGKICLIDVDDDWFGLHPEPTSFQSLRQKIAKARQDMGGDPWVGQKLGTYLSKAGFRNVQVRVEMISSDLMGMENFLSLFSFGKLYPSVDQGLIAIAQKDIQQLLTSAHVWGGFGLFYSTGRPSLG